MAIKTWTGKTRTVDISKEEMLVASVQSANSDNEWLEELILRKAKMYRGICASFLFGEVLFKKILKWYSLKRYCLEGMHAESKDFF